ncbi:MAG: hypothetical protein WC807_21205 [Hyphomicrobium sp.]|jgi:hypothetical protein
MIWRGLVALSGAAVVVAATNANVLHAGGYGTPDAWLAIAVAALLALGTSFAVITWQDGRPFQAFALGSCLVAGEAYWLAINAEREIAAREALAAPVIAAQARFEGARERVTKAEDAKRNAADAMISEAAKPGCKSGCVALLSEAKRSAEIELQAARDALAGLEPPRSATPLPDRLGIAPWSWDLALAVLRSLAIFGGSIAIGVAAHPRRDRNAKSTDAIIGEPISRVQLVPPPVDPREHVSQFLRAVIRPDPAGAASLRELHARYIAWCSIHGVAPLPGPDLGRELRSIVDALGLECESRSGDVVVWGAALAK